MAVELSELVKKKRCAFYNDLSHMNPMYAVAASGCTINAAQEVLRHKRNIYLLAIQFDHIIIGIDNITGFTKYTQVEIIGRVVTSEWFGKLVDAGIIILSGWGARRNPDMVNNQIEYASKYKSELKSRDYLRHIQLISASAEMVVRDPEDGEPDHIKYLLRRIRSTCDMFSICELHTIVDFIISTNERVGHVGTMDIFPIADKILLGKPDKEKAFYTAYYASWQDYSYDFYGPAITIDTAKISTIADGIQNKSGPPNTLYSPEFFFHFLNARLGDVCVYKILSMPPELLIRIRNGDWMVFVSEYHKYLESAEEVMWVCESVQSPDFLTDKKLMEIVTNEILSKMIISTVDAETWAAVVNSAINMAWMGTPIAPLARLLKDRINKIVHVGRQIGREHGWATECFFRKLENAANGGMVIQLGR
jgi:transcriptional regulator of met regulon